MTISQETNTDKAFDADQATAAMPSDALGFSRELEGGAAAGGTSSNRPPAIPNMMILRKAIDTLFLSAKGELHSDVRKELDRLKELAQHDDPTAQYCINDHVFEVMDKGTKGYAYCLADNALFIKINKAANTLPFAIVHVSSAYLTTTPLDVIKADIESILDHLGAVEAIKISRFDVCVDFVTDYDFSQHCSKDYVSRGRNYARYEENNSFTGVSVGAGGDVSFRLYDKTVELKKKPRDYLTEIWKSAGWTEDRTVNRAEFQIRRAAAKSLRHQDTKSDDASPDHLGGINTIDDLIKFLPSVWNYCTHQWLRLTEPNEEDKHRERWPTMPVWEALQGAFDDGDVYPTTRHHFTFCRVPNYRRLFKSGFSGLTSYMAMRGIEDPHEAFEKMFAEAEDYLDWWLEESLQGYLQDKVAAKKRAFNQYNPPAVPENDSYRDPDPEEEYAEYLRSHD